MADYTGDPDRSTPDYELDDVLELTEATQYHALFEDTRSEIVSLLLERAATTTELAEALDKPKGTVGHHLKVLEAAGLVRVVRTRRVRALEAKYYGRTARVFVFHRIGPAATDEQRVLSTAAAEFAGLDLAEGVPAKVNRRFVRIPTERAAEWNARLGALLVEFGEQPRGGDTIWAMVVALYPTARRPLPDVDDSDADSLPGAET